MKKWFRPAGLLRQSWITNSGSIVLSFRSPPPPCQFRFVSCGHGNSDVSEEFSKRHSLIQRCKAGKLSQTVAGRAVNVGHRFRYHPATPPPCSMKGFLDNRCRVVRRVFLPVVPTLRPAMEIVSGRISDLIETACVRHAKIVHDAKGHDVLQEWTRFQTSPPYANHCCVF
jgi:hypothetical protein